ncbi:MAG: hypothetical protein SOX40_07270, partial [Bacteroidaceae bacterium]|nr:hypothetical protein [Bacteroidaceae bacterium]
MSIAVLVRIKVRCPEISSASFQVKTAVIAIAGRRKEDTVAVGSRHLIAFVAIEREDSPLAFSHQFFKFLPGRHSPLPSPVVTDSITSNQLTEFLEKCLGLKHLRFKRGYRNVINKAIELNNSGIDSQLAIETSGHGAFKENYFLDDGAYLATKIVIKAARLKQ